MANKWFKFYGGDYLSDPKVERLSPLERSCWITILCMASMGESGMIEFLTVESLLNRSGIQFDPYHPEEWERALSVLIKFKQLKMIDTNKDGQITVINWEKRQEHNLTVAERVAKSRLNKKNVTTNVTSVTTDKNRIEENRIDKKILNTPAPKGAEDDVQKFISLFGGINPSYGELFKRKNQRAAATRLLKMHPIDWWSKFMDGYVGALEDKFCPRATTPAQLEDKLAAIMVYGRSKQSKGVKLV